MAIENERKYILDITAPVKYMKMLKQQPGVVSYNIEQSYLDDRARIRMRENQATGESEFFFTYKVKTQNGLVEIEKEIDEREWKMLNPSCKTTIRKTRVCVPVGDLVWEVDFFIHDTIEGPYLVMAEVELAEDAELPDSEPAFISDYKLHLVERDDRRFDNAKLVRPLTIKILIEKMKNGQL
jgi:CYTH domain-containing protein